MYIQSTISSLTNETVSPSFNGIGLLHKCSSARREARRARGAENQRKTFGRLFGRHEQSPSIPACGLRRVYWLGSFGKAGRFNAPSDPALALQTIDVILDLGQE